jgi:hypothetical protein
VSIFLRHAEEILEIALHGTEQIGIVVDRQGTVRTVDPAGWSMPSLRVEYGARFVYKVERCAGTVRVEGWDGAQSCVLQRSLPLHDALSGGRRRAGGEHRFQDVVAVDLDRRALSRELQPYHLAVLGHPHAVDQAILGSILGIPDRHSHQAIPKREYDPLQHHTVSVPD